MAWLDFAFLGIVLLSLVIGMLRGFVREVLSLATWILAFVVTLKFAPLAAEHLQDTIHAVAARTAIAYALVFFGVLIAGAFVSHLVGVLIRSSGLRPIDRMLGLGFGLLRGALLIVAVVMIAGFSSLHEESWWRQSQLASQLQPAAKSLQSLIPQTWLAYLQPAETKPGKVTVSSSEH